jgi:hypothetical protein
MFVYNAAASDGLCCLLTKPCPREPEQIPFKDLEVNRSEIQLLTKLGAGQFGEVYAGNLTILVSKFLSREIAMI